MSALESSAASTASADFNPQILTIRVIRPLGMPAQAAGGAMVSRGW
jgi:hypothetical protein